MTIAFIRTYNNKQNSEVQEAVIREFAESQKIEILAVSAQAVTSSIAANTTIKNVLFLIIDTI